jgi:hypothetical protein
MRKIPVRTDAMQFAVANPATPVADYDTEGRPQRRDANGRPLWQLDVLIIDAAGMSIERIKVPADTEPVFAPQTAVVVEGLTATPYVSGNRAALSFTATAIKAAPAPAGTKAT